MKIISQLRKVLSIHIEKAIIKNTKVTIFSDDCWASAYYQGMKIPYFTPTIGLWIEPKDYLNFLDNLKDPHASELIFDTSAHDFPVANTPFAKIHFMHYENQIEAIVKFHRRWERIDWKRVYYKIDFGKDGYSKEDVERWNRMKLPRSVAIVPLKKSAELGYVYNQVTVPEWVVDGLHMFNVSRRHFDFYNWLNKGTVRKSSTVKMFHLLLIDSGVIQKFKSSFINNHWC